MMPEGAAFESKVRRTLEAHSMARAGDHILVAVSGGADSVALLHCLARVAPALGFRLTVAHLNHTLRGDESRKDENFVAALSLDLGLPYRSGTADVRASAAARRANLEAEARRLRYEFLRKSAGEAGASRIAVGHTSDDQAETVLLRLLRGSGFTGLAGIRPVLGDLIVRPLIECSRKDVVEYLRLLGVRWREDRSNTDLSLRRNRIRHELLPYLETHFNPGIRAVLSREASLARTAADYLSAEARKWLDGARACEAGGISLSVAQLATAHPAVRSAVFRLAFNELAEASLSSRHVESLLTLCEPGGARRRTGLPAGWVAAREHDRIRIGRPGRRAEPFLYVLPVPGSCAVPQAGLEITARREQVPESLLCSPERVYLAAETLPDDLQIRSRKPGDAYGGPGHRKVKRMLIDRKIPLNERDAVPLVVSGDTVLWIPGFLPPRHLRARAGSGDILILESRRSRSAAS